MSAHTPGPWTADETRERGNKGWQIAARDGDVSVANIEGYQGCSEGSLRLLPRDEAYANARLIAAAPELLEALKFAQAVLEEHIASDCDICGGEGGHEREGADFRLTPVRHKDGCEYLTVTAAIAKAEGR